MAADHIVLEGATGIWWLSELMRLAPLHGYAIALDEAHSVAEWDVHFRRPGDSHGVLELTATDRVLDEYTWRHHCEDLHDLGVHVSNMSVTGTRFECDIIWNNATCTRGWCPAHRTAHLI